MMRYANYIIFLISIALFNSCEIDKKSDISVVNFDELYSKIDLSSGDTYVINFWATWCSPCVKELPYFEYVNKEYSDKNVKVILVSLDFPSQIKSKLKPYIFSKNILSEEAPAAYKNVDTVIENTYAANLARPVIRLEPLAVIKG
mgnify:CR=1 FL=1